MLEYRDEYPKLPLVIIHLLDDMVKTKNQVMKDTIHELVAIIVTERNVDDFVEEDLLEKEGTLVKSRLARGKAKFLGIVDKAYLMTVVKHAKRPNMYILVISGAEVETKTLNEEVEELEENEITIPIEDENDREKAEELAEKLEECAITEFKVDEDGEDELSITYTNANKDKVEEILEECGVELSDEEEDEFDEDEPLEEANNLTNNNNNNNNNNNKRKSTKGRYSSDDDFKPGVGKIIVTKRKDDLSKMDLKQLQKYIDKNWEEIYEVMKAGKLYPTYGFRINTNGMENFETITLSIDFTDNKEKSNVVRVATNFAKKNPGLFIVLDRTYMSFAVLKSEDIIEIMSPLIKKLASLGYGTIIKGIFGKNISKLVKIFNDEEKNSAYKDRENWKGSIDNPVIYIGSYDIKNIDKNIDKISSYAKKLDGYAFINKNRSGMRRYLIEVEFNNEDNFLKLATYMQNDLGVKIDYIMDAVNSNDRNLSYKIAKNIEKTLKINID